MTPAQQAKEYAAANGFIIEPVGRRYRIARNGQANVTIAEVGGYPAALNAMKADHTMQMASVDLAKDSSESNALAEVVVANCIGHIRGIIQAPAETIEAFNQRVSNAANWPIKTPEQIRQDMRDGIERLRAASADMVAMQTGNGKTLDDLGEKYHTPKRKPGQTDAAYRNVLMYGDERGMKYVDFDPSFDSFDVAAQARIRKAARRIVKQRRRLSRNGAHVNGPWHVIFNGKPVIFKGHPTRSDAVRLVRWGFNHSDPKIRNNWRTASLAVEYRPS